MKTYPVIGQKHTYLRADQDGTIHEGRGTVVSIFLSPECRTMVQVHDGANVFNVDLGVLDYTPDERAAYSAMIADVQRLSAEGNAKARAIVDEYNGKVAALYSSFFGEPTDMSELEAEKLAAARVKQEAGTVQPANETAH